MAATMGLAALVPSTWPHCPSVSAAMSPPLIVESAAADTSFMSLIEQPVNLLAP